jgi:hypothetical protein
VPQAAAPLRPRVVLRQGQNLPEVGLHQCPSERKGEKGSVRRLRVPSQVPSLPQNAAKVRGFFRTASGFTAETDCLLEGSGFEPSVPRKAPRLQAAFGFLEHGFPEPVRDSATRSAAPPRKISALTLA